MNFALSGDLIYLGDGQTFSADTLAPAGQFRLPPWVAQPLYSVATVSALNRVGFFTPNDHRFEAFDLTTREWLGGHSVPGEGADPRSLCQWGERGFAQLLNDFHQLRIWESPPITSRTADVGVSVNVPTEAVLGAGSNISGTAEFDWVITVTNRGPDIAHLVRLTFDDQSQPDQVLGSLAAGMSRQISFHKVSGLPGFARDHVTVHSAAHDPNPADNSALLETVVPLPVAGSVKALMLDLSHVIGSPAGDRLYAAVTRMPGDQPGGVAVVNPVTATVERVLPVGEDPRQLAVTADGQRLYVQLGTNRLVRWNFTQNTLDLDQTFTNETLLDFAPLADASGGHVVATERRLAVYDGDVRRAVLNFPPASSRYLTTAGGLLWMVRPGELRGYLVTTGGFALKQTVPLTLFSEYYHFTGDDRHLYFAGAVYDFVTKQMLNGLGGDNFVPEPARGVVYSAYGASTIRRYDKNKLNLLAEEPIPSAYTGYGVGELVRWGEDGLALRLGGQSLLLFHAAAVPSGTADLAVTVAVPPVTLVGFPYAATIIVTNRSDTPAPRGRLSVVFENGNLGSGGVFSLSDALVIRGGGSSFLVDLGDLRPHGGAVVSVTGSNFFRGFNLTATVVAGVNDLNPDNNTASGFTLVDYPTTDFSAVALLAPARVNQGAEFDLTVVLTNRGPYAVNDASFGLLHWPGLNLLGTTLGRIGGVECSSPTHCVIGLGHLAASEGLAVTLRLRVDDPGVIPLQVLPTASTLLYVAATNPAAGPVSEFRLPSRFVAWSDARQQLVAHHDGGLMVLAMDTFALVKQIPAPDFTGLFSLTDDGRYVWAALNSGEVVRLSLDTGAEDLRFGVGRNLSAPYGALAAFPGNDDLLLVASLDSNGNPKVTAYARGVARPSEYSSFNGFSRGLFLAVDAGGRTFVATGRELRELRVDADGVTEQRNLDAANSSLEGPLTLAANHFFFGTERAVDVDTLEAANIFKDYGLVVGDPLTRLAYHATPGRLGFGGQSASLRAYDAATLRPLWRRNDVADYSEVSAIVPLGTNGVLLLGDKARLVRPPDPTSRATDLAVTAALVNPVLGTNQPLTFNFSVTNRSPWSAAGAKIRVEFSAGLELAGLISPLELPLPTADVGTNLALNFRTTLAGPQWVRAQVSSDLPESAPADNVAEATLVTPPPPRLLLGDAAVLEGNNGSDGLVTAVLTSPAATALDVVFRLELISAQAADVVGNRVTFHFNAGETLARVRIVQDDLLAESDETLRLIFESGPVTPVQPAALITIRDNDLLRLTASSPTVPEGNTGMTLVRVPLVLSQAPLLPVEVSYSVGAGTATAGEDFIPRSGRLVFAPGQRTNYVTVTVLGDRVFEPAETVRVIFGDVSGLATPDPAIITIRNDDALPVPVAGISRTSGAVQVAFNSVIGATYHLEYRTNFTTDSWQALTDPVNGTGATIVVPVGMKSGRTLFLRVVAE